MAAVAGMRGTGDWGTDERPKNFRETILWRSPNGSAPLLALSSKMKSEAVNDPEFSWWEEEQNALRLTMANGTAYATTDTTIVVSSNLQDAQDAVAGDLFLVEKDLTAAYDNEVIINGIKIFFFKSKACRGRSGIGYRAFQRRYRVYVKLRFLC